MHGSTDGSGDLGPGFETEPEVELGLGDGGEEAADAAGAWGWGCVEVEEGADVGSVRAGYTG